MARRATEPDGTLPPAAPPMASQRAPEGEPGAADGLVDPRWRARRRRRAVRAADPASARPQGIRYAGSRAPKRGAAEPAAEPDTTAAAPDGPHEDYWDGNDAAQFAGLVYPAREAGAHPDAAAGHASGDSTGPAGDVDEHTVRDDDDTEAGGPAARREPAEIDEDAPPFATAPFATVPRLNRVRSMPVPPGRRRVAHAAQLAQRLTTRAVAMAAIPSPRPVRPSPSVVVADRDTGAPESASLSTAIASARRVTRSSAGSRSRNGNVPDGEPGLSRPDGRSPAAAPPREPRPLRPRRTEMRPEVPEPRRREQRVTGRMGGRVPVGMPGQPRLARPIKPSEIEDPPILERMHVNPEPHPRQVLHRSRLPARTWRERRGSPRRSRQQYSLT